MEYDFNQIGPQRLERLLNAILTARFGEDARLTPLRGPDGASDGETAPDNPHMYFDYKNSAQSGHPLFSPPRPGRYLFQAKYHRTGDQRLSDLRALVVQEFKRELETAVLNRADRSDVNYFFLITNVPSSVTAIKRVDAVRKNLLSRRQDRGLLHADVWWREFLVMFLDRSPDLWLAYPELFPGAKPPRIALTASASSSDAISRTFRLAVSSQYTRDEFVKFRQIELKQKLVDLFVDLDVDLSSDLQNTLAPSLNAPMHHDLLARGVTTGFPLRAPQIDTPPTALGLLINDELAIRKILLEGGPGQGKSTITQMAAQIYREKMLGYSDCSSRDTIWTHISKLRFPFRIELRRFAEWLSSECHRTIDQYIATTIGKHSGGASFDVRDLHAFVENSAVLLMLDGLDEIGSDQLRDQVITSIMDVIDRFENALRVDLRVVLTTRPPALVGRRDRLAGFSRVVVAPMKPSRIDDYLDRWLTAQAMPDDERRRIEVSFNARRDAPHVNALARNPMQLSVLLQFISLKGEAFPDHRAQLYRDYFQIVIDRDVEKSPELRDNREVVEGLHSYLGLYFHGSAEINQRRRELSRAEIIRVAQRWLESDGHSGNVAARFFALGEERFGLVVALSGEGEATTYGFEVQPIQEYFAAAYISNRLPYEQAHEIFGRLLHRSYWREVALFLAGLRRPNEKADLVARARAADRDHLGTQRQDGRAIVLQLLREGVFSYPPHVGLDAIEFVTDLLDMTELRARRTPDDFVDIVCEFSDLFPSDSLCDKVVRLARNQSQSEDSYAVLLVHQVAARLLPESTYGRILDGYCGRRPLLRSLVLMALPYATARGAVIRRLAAVDNYWRGVPVAIWARRLWRAALSHRMVLDLEFPAEMHSWLVVEFATDYSVRRSRGARQLEFEGSQPFAIWKLYQNMRLLGDYLARTMERGGERALLSEEAAAAPLVSLSYDQLSSEVASTVRDLIEASDRLLKLAARNERDDAFGKHLERYVSVVKDRVKEPGIAGWIAARCAIDLVGMSPHALLALVGRDVVDDLLSAFREVGRMDVRWESYAAMPIGVRLSHGAAPVSLHEIIADRVLRRSDSFPPAVRQWIYYVPLPIFIIRPLVETCRSNIVGLLRFLSDRRVVGFTNRRLVVQDTRLILRACRNTEDEAVLRGAATVLLNASYARIVAPALMVRILAVAPTSRLASQIFDITEGVFSGSRLAHFTLARSASDIILGDADRYPTGLVVRAATFSSEHATSATVPLLEECPSLVNPEP